MNTEAFVRAYAESRNGANYFQRHIFNRHFLSSDGVVECANAGCHWLVDKLATELPAEFKKRPGEYMCIVKVVVANSKAEIVGEFRDDDPNPYRSQVDYTDMPDGTWTFFVSVNHTDLVLILPTEY